MLTGLFFDAGFISYHDILIQVPLNLFLYIFPTPAACVSEGENTGYNTATYLFFFSAIKSLH